jgi:hypothetical protein
MPGLLPGIHAAKSDEGLPLEAAPVQPILAAQPGADGRDEAVIPTLAVPSGQKLVPKPLK